ncbi:hypothetical protein OGAPHI_006899 [Ogataea philodendri]|uniref:Autophagy-related protein 16 domain-containing protein n=1 Tax=Ogataea philodendri TaxID=1378263 RepID=A0A9P8NUV8_9ASCO|nr:uncharacterized protein OGAPHI_006899 [Ogataea philodendri]KAH3660313.1 hypothetical protein OGAPHI_006899 [Ogataea philodendri]
MVIKTQIAHEQNKLHELADEIRRVWFQVRATVNVGVVDVGAKRRDSAAPVQRQCLDFEVHVMFIAPFDKTAFGSFCHVSSGTTGVSEVVSLDKDDSCVSYWVFGTVSHRTGELPEEVPNILSNPLEFCEPFQNAHEVVRARLGPKLLNCSAAISARSFSMDLADCCSCEFWLLAPIQDQPNHPFAGACSVFADSSGWSLGCSVDRHRGFVHVVQESCCLPQNPNLLRIPCCSVSDSVQREDGKQEILALLSQVDSLTKKLESKDKQLKQELDKNASMSKEIDIAKKNIQVITDAYKKLQDRHSRLQEESKVKLQNVESLNDDILSLNIENNLLNDRLTKTKLEYELLVNRWMNRVKQEAEVLNDANEALSRSEKTDTPEP